MFHRYKLKNPLSHFLFLWNMIDMKETKDKTIWQLTLSIYNEQGYCLIDISKIEDKNLIPPANLLLPP